MPKWATASCANVEHEELQGEERTCSFPPFDLGSPAFSLIRGDLSLTPSRRSLLSNFRSVDRRLINQGSAHFVIPSLLREPKEGGVSRMRAHREILPHLAPFLSNCSWRGWRSRRRTSKMPPESEYIHRVSLLLHPRSISCLHSAGNERETRFKGGNDGSVSFLGVHLRLLGGSGISQEVAADVLLLLDHLGRRPN